MAQRWLVRAAQARATEPCVELPTSSVHGRMMGGSVRLLNLIIEHTRECLLVQAERRWSSARVISALADVMVMKGSAGTPSLGQWARVRSERPTEMAGQDRSKDAVYRTRFAVGKRLLRELQLQATGRVPQRGNLLLDERTARAGRTLARPLQHDPAALLAGIQITGTGGVADKQHGVWRSVEIRYAPLISPHPRRRLLELRNSCVTLTLPTVQRIGHSRDLCAAQSPGDEIRDRSRPYRCRRRADRPRPSQNRRRNDCKSSSLDPLCLCSSVPTTSSPPS